MSASAGSPGPLGHSPSPSLLTTCPNSRKSPANSRGCWGEVWASKVSRGEQEPFINCGKSLPGASDSKRSPCRVFEAAEKGGKDKEGHQRHRNLLVRTSCLVCTPIICGRWQSESDGTLHFLYLSVYWCVSVRVTRLRGKLFSGAKLLLIAFSPFFFF